MAVLRFGNDTVSGVGIRYDMNAPNTTLGWRNMFDFSNPPGKAINSGLDVRMPNPRYQGHEALMVDINGWIDTSLSPGTTTVGQPGSGAINVQINLGALGSLSLIGSGYLYWPAVNVFLGKHPQDLFVSGAELGGSVSAILTNVRILPNTSYIKGGSEYLFPYSAQFVVVSGPV